MQALTDSIQIVYGPGVTIWGKGDRAHEGSASDHNEDDTRGSKPEQTDADNVPEHRAIDVALLGPFDMDDARQLRRRLVERSANQRRMRYVILEQNIWRKRAGWVQERYSGAYHGHLHVSGDAFDDENGAPWDIGPDPASTSTDVPKGDDHSMRILIANLEGRATIWTGLRNSEWQLTAESDEETVSGLVHAGGARVMFKSARALVGATGPMAGKTVDESVKAVEAAG
jgi:hypothetical protein